VRVGGFVIHGDGAEGLGRCLGSLAEVADEVVAVGSGDPARTDPAVREAGARALHHPWQGYGAAREVAARALAHCDYLFFLDSDEWLEPHAVAAFRAWRRSGARAPAYTAVRRDWADLPGGRFLFACEPHVRLVRPDRATWSRAMLVHEAIPLRGARRSGVLVEHAFTRDLAAFREKEERYALLWALQAHAAGRRPKWPAAQQGAHALRLALVKGAALRGGLDGLRLAWAFGAYHGRKHALLGRLRAGEHADLVEAVADGRLEELYRALPAAATRARR
jgi:glycosyltransferase involved in cell wall biosynthesis